MAQTDREQEPLRWQVHGMSHAAQPVGGPMKNQLSRRSLLGRISAVAAGGLGAPAGKAAKTVTQKLLVASDAPKGYDPTQHKWVMAIDANRCIGCGLCAEACKKENHVSEGPYFRTWVERYILTKHKPGSGAARGETLVDCPNGGINGYPEAPVLKEEIQHSFFVPKLCNLCKQIGRASCRERVEISV